MLWKACPINTDHDFANTIFVSKFVCFFKQCIHVQEVMVTQIYGSYRVTFEEVISIAEASLSFGQSAPSLLVA